ncbi:hypothetical protein BBJ28_00013121 [Nothophytophthora sp. Chile5]|nr:hypothetical protein BBJ28_00013121 [Nothophytophthora sp. Chile5]
MDISPWLADWLTNSVALFGWQVRSEVQQQALQELTQNLQEKCFDKCLTRPNGKLDGKQQNCLALCINRYIDTMKVVSEAMVQRGPQDTNVVICCLHPTRPLTAFQYGGSIQGSLSRIPARSHKRPTIDLSRDLALYQQIHRRIKQNKQEILEKMAEPPITEQQVVATYKSLRAEVRQMSEKISELELETTEHDRVIQTLSELPKDRKAFRMVGGVLVERTVQEVLPAVTSNRDGIAQVLAQLNESIKQKEASADAWQVRPAACLSFWVGLVGFECMEIDVMLVFAVVACATDGLPHQRKYNIQVQQ